MISSGSSGNRGESSIISSIHRIAIPEHTDEEDIDDLVDKKSLELSERKSSEKSIEDENVTPKFSK